MPPDDASALRDIRDAATFIARAVLEVRQGTRSETDEYVVLAIERQFTVMERA